MRPNGAEPALADAADENDESVGLSHVSDSPGKGAPKPDRAEAGPDRATFGTTGRPPRAVE
jgi:hypothetical protein